MSRANEKQDNLEADIVKHASRFETDASRSTTALQSLQQCLVEQTIETPVVSLAEKIVEMPVTQTEEKTQQVVNTHVQHVVNKVKSGEARNHQADSAEPHHSGEDQPGDQAHRGSQVHIV